MLLALQQNALLATPVRAPISGGGALWSRGNKPGFGWHDYRLGWRARHDETSDIVAALAAVGVVDVDVWAALLSFEERE